MKKEFIFEQPQPFANCHAATLVQAKNGDFVVAWFGGTREKNPDVGIWMSRRLNGKWLPPYEVVKTPGTANWNPVLYCKPDGRILLFYKAGQDIYFWKTFIMSSKDNGATWTLPEELVPGDESGGRGPVKNKPVLLSNGTLIAGASTEFDGIWEAFVDLSSDGGATWQRSRNIPIDRKKTPGAGIIQPTIWESSPGNVHMLLRSGCGFICRSDSNDFGRTWKPVYTISLPNNNSGIDLVRLDDGTLVLAANPISDSNGSEDNRTVLSLFKSTDNSESWSKLTDLEHEKDGEFSYPAIISTKEGIATAYTWKRESIAFCLIDI